jgi:hypothetical protein
MDRIDGAHPRKERSQASMSLRSGVLGGLFGTDVGVTEMDWRNT